MIVIFSNEAPNTIREYFAIIMSRIYIINLQLLMLDGTARGNILKERSKRVSIVQAAATVTWPPTGC